jgi:hypothetical protein
MNIKPLSHACITGLLVVALLPMAFAQPEQGREKQTVQQQIQQQQREKARRLEQAMPDAEAQETELTASPPMSGEQERLFRQQQIQQQQIRRQEIEDRAQRDMLQDAR